MEQPGLDDSLRVNHNPVTLREVVLEKLRGAITHFQLLPGERLVERDLCERLGVSRTSVREALRHLESEGLVEFADARGPRVSVIDAAAAGDLYELRCVLEALVVQRFTRSAEPVQIDALTLALQAVGATTEQQGPMPLSIALEDFYQILLRGCGNPIAAQQLRQIRARIGYLEAAASSSSRRREALGQELQAMVSAIASADELAAHQASVAHVRAAARAALAHLGEHNGEAEHDAAPVLAGALDDPRARR